MTHAPYASHNHNGSILLFLSVIIFSGALAAAAITWYFTNKSIPASSPQESPMPAEQTETPIDFLSPQTEIDADLNDNKDTLQKNLITPLRLYYATQNERLTTIKVQSNDDEKYRIRVSLTLVKDLSQAERTITFLYDLSPWNPSQLDNQP